MNDQIHPSGAPEPGLPRFSEATPLPALVAGAVGGHQVAWSSLVTRFAPLLSCVVNRYRLSENDADDVRQTVWLHMVQHLKDLRDPSALPGWIVTTTRNEALKVLSGKRRLTLVDPLDQLDHRLDRIEQTQPDTDLLRAECRQAVQAGLASLQQEHRELIELTFADSPMSYQQISGKLGIPIGSIGPTRARCVKKLRTTAAVRALAS